MKRLVMKRLFDRAESFLDRAPELWRENIELVELNRRFLWFILLRFGVIGALATLGLAKSFLFPALDISPFGLFLAAGILLPLNIFYWFYYEWAITYHAFPENTKLVAQNVQVQIILDFFILGFLVYECGGIESPLIYFFLFHNTLSCLFFEKRVSLFHTLLSIAIVLAIVLLTSFGILPEKHFIDPATLGTPSIPRTFDHYYLAGVVSVYLFSWYLISTITENLRIQEQQLQEKIQEMTELSREKTRYLLVTTHELKAPFAAIQSYINVALDGYAGDIPEKLMEILKKIGARCDLLARRITDMIQLANITSLKEHRQNIVTARVNLSELLITAAGRFKNLGASKHVTIEIGELSSQKHFAEVDAQQIDILFNNIIANAISYAFPSTAIRVAITEGETSISVSVSNHGIGIKREHMEKVFLEHFRTERAVEMNPNSTGLGLTIARQIMDIHGGSIRIDSEVDRETTVFMVFPKPPS